jgi:uncharacterized membrane protein YeaQ/YmgE (transglycosylase-associated protein family)
MGFMIALLVGLLAAIAASVIMTKGYPGGFFLTALLGVAGSITAWLLGTGLGWTVHGYLPGIIASSIGAIITLGAHRLIAGAHAA